METKGNSPVRRTSQEWEENHLEQEILQRDIITVQERLEQLQITKERTLTLFEHIKGELGPHDEHISEHITHLVDFITARTSNSKDTDKLRKLVLTSYDNLTREMRRHFQDYYMKIFEEYEDILNEINYLEKERIQKKEELSRLTHDQAVMGIEFAIAPDGIASDVRDLLGEQDGPRELLAEFLNINMTDAERKLANRKKSPKSSGAEGSRKHVSNKRKPYKRKPNKSKTKKHRPNKPKIKKRRSNNLR